MWRASVLAFGALCLAGVASVAMRPDATAASEVPVCPPSTRTPRYPDVQPIFAQHCASCHDARKGDNAAAQRVFEMSRYPFATRRPGTLLADLRAMFAARSKLAPREKCTGFAWIDGGALDGDGKPPRWR